MSMLRTILRDRRFHRLAGGMLVLAAGILLLAWRMGVDGVMLKSWWHQTEAFLAGRPMLLFAALVILPGLPVPTSALLFLAGTVWRDRPVIACAICLLAIALNLTWTYWLAARPGRFLVEKLIINGGLRIPELPLGNHLKLLLVLRLTPGLPLFIQNYLLGFLRVPFGLYLGISISCTGLIACGVVLSGAGIADGNLKPVLAGVGLIVLGWVAVQWMKSRIR